MSAAESTSVPLRPIDAVTGIRTLSRSTHLSVVEPPPIRSRCIGWRRHAKRAFDVVVVLLALPVALPVLAVLAIVTAVASPGPILFRQERIGRGGRPFTMLKFRTMYTDSTERLVADGALYARYAANDFKLPVGEDPRIAPCGRIMRKTSLDELPQLFNVLRGDMSLVGPRPVVADELRSYGSIVGAYMAVKPGITGRWQTEGRNEVRYPERAILDAQYVEQFRLRSDLMILCKTVPSVVRRTGVH